MTHRRCCVEAKRIVIKVGTYVLTGDGRYVVDRSVFAHLVQSIAQQILEENRRVVLVSSGAIGLGRQRLGKRGDIKDLSHLQALAALGQSALMQLYEHEFAFYDLLVGQILLTRDDIDDRRRFINARHTIRLLSEELNAVPIVNENDTVANDEIRLSDNDWLAALVASICEADLLCILSDVAGIMTSNPREDPNASLLVEVHAEDHSLDERVGGHGSRGGRGGMMSKLNAARMAAKTGIPTVIGPGREPNVIHRILSGEPVGTLVIPPEGSIGARRLWLRHGVKPAGTLVIDTGAVEAIIQRGTSLLARGILKVEGKFSEGAAVDIVDPDHRLIARGLSSYASSDLKRIAGHKSSEIEEILGFRSINAAVHRDDLVLAE
ncbi:MAG: glutamate 5-kinase [Bradymonadales bacterium]|nr:glutamate 5-kinase [Bradymonadales bacterium]